ncbi:MAG: hypothetical protein ACYDFT_07455 [Thermoplasmata archaeon]
MTKIARQSVLGLFLFVLLLGSATAYLVTFGLLLNFAGGTVFGARDAGIAWGVAGAVALVAFSVLFRMYAQVDQTDRRFKSLEDAAVEIEKAFWAKF